MRKYALAALLWLLAGCQQTDNYVRAFGDSLTAAVDSWAFMMHENDWAVVYNHAQGGLTWRDFTAPDWINCDQTDLFRRKVVIWLGANDAMHGNTHAVGPHVARSLEILTAMDCDIHLVLPPQEPPYHSERLTPRWEKVRQEIIATAALYGVVAHEVDYDWGETVDGLHPTTEQHERIAIQMSAILNLPWKVEQ